MMSMKAWIGCGCLWVLPTGCRLEVALVGIEPQTEDTFSPTTPTGPVVATLDTAPATGNGYLVEAHVHVLGPKGSETLVPWAITGGLVVGPADNHRDLVYAPLCGPRCGDEGWLEIDPGEDPWLADFGGVGQQLGSPGTGVALLTCDLDGNGFDEVAIADVDEVYEPSDGPVEPENVTVFWNGNTGGIGGTMQPSPNADDVDFGLDLSCGDFDRNGVDDLVVASAGHISIFKAVGKTLRLMSTSPLSRPPTALSGTGDADGNGAPDFAYGDERGVIRWDGTPEGILLYGSGGDRPVAAGDVNGDGYDDLLVTSRPDPLHASVTLLLGAEGPDAWTFPAWTLNIGATAAIPRVVALSDLDGDGFREVVVSTIDDRLQGRFDLFRGTANGLMGAPAFSLSGVDGQELGFGLANLGDLDGDGRDDLGATSRQRVQFSWEDVLLLFTAGER